MIQYFYSLLVFRFLSVTSATIFSPRCVNLYNSSSFSNQDALSSLRLVKWSYTAAVEKPVYADMYNYSWNWVKN